MKKLIGISLFVFFGMTSLQAQTVKHAGQEVKEGAKKVGHATAKGAKKVGHKTAELASKGKSKITDKTVKDKTGPNGETIYLDDNSKYYWVDKKGHKQYISEAELRNKQD